MEKEIQTMKIFNLKFRTEKPAFYDVEMSVKGDIFYYDEQERRHRLNEPAVERINGDRAWYAHGKLHRLDGPAREWINGDKEWWVNNEFIGCTFDGFTDKDFEQWKQKHPKLCGVAF